MSDFKKSFTFIVLAYNHEDYIIEHLESIKFLIERYGENINVSIIVNDDCSKDSTVNLVSLWLDVNFSIFHKVTNIFNKTNLGTCKSLLNAINVVDSDSLKITAGDDVYSCENIFDYAFLSDDCAILSGVPLSLVDGKLYSNKSDTFNIIASQVVYEKKLLIDRFVFLSNNNAPNIFYNNKVLMDQKVRDFLHQYDVVEDWPIQIAIAQNYPQKKFVLTGKVFVYYRRTIGSTYLVAGSRFFKDKSNCYSYLISSSEGLFKKLFLRNRLFLFERGNTFFNKFFNAAFYLYVGNVLVRGVRILKKVADFNPDVEEHNKHYDFIVTNSKCFLDACCNDRSGSN